MLAMIGKAQTDAGSVAIELLVLGILIPALITSFGLNALLIQRHSLAAQQLAREAVRLSALGRLDERSEQALVEQEATELGLADNDVSLTVTAAIRRLGRICEVTATVAGRIEKARMVAQP